MDWKKDEKQKATTELMRQWFEGGLSCEEIAQRLNEAGHVTHQGKAFTAATVTQRLRPYKKIMHRKDETANASIISEEDLKGRGRRASEATEAIETAGPLPAAWRKEIIEIVRAEISALSDRQIGPNLQTTELPPVPGKVRAPDTGRRVQAGKRVKIAGTCDAELERLFTKWREQRGLDLSRALDVALWYFLDKPKLSFQHDED